MTEYKHIFTPCQIGRLTVKNRIQTAPAMPFLATQDCDVSRELIEWERAFAKGGASIVTVGDTPVVSEHAQAVGHILDLGTDKVINGLSRLAETIQRYGAKASIELTHGIHVRYSPTDMSLAEIRALVGSYAGAAYRCAGAGMDMILVHGAHGHIIGDFFSPRRNRRTDAYGGTAKNRARFASEVLTAIREKVGDALAIEYRISGDELVPGGLCFEEQLEFVRLIEDKIDLLHVSAGRLHEVETLPRIIQPTYVERGVNVHFAEMFKKELGIPVATVGSLDLAMAEEIIARGRADMVALNRAFIADPDGVAKAKAGLAETIRPCVRCNTCIERTHMFYLPVRCAVNPLSGREAEFRHQPAPAKKKRVVVAGGGPAGMEAARTAAARGHAVVLLERGDALGGNLVFAAAPTFKEDMRRYLEWAVYTTTHTPGITVKLGTAATPESVAAEDPDSLIVAVGADPVVADVPGAAGSNVLWVGDVYVHPAKVGDRVVVAGAGLAGSEAALHLAKLGRKVTLIDMLPLEKVDAGTPFINVFALRDQLEKNHVVTKTEVKLDTVTGAGVVIIDKDWHRTQISCDTVVLALGLAPRAADAATLAGAVGDAWLAGDCRNRRGNLLRATTEGFNAAMEI